MSNLADLFKQLGHTWNFSDGTRIPNQDEIDKTIAAAKGMLAAEPDGAQVEVGRLIVKKAGTNLDVYLHVLEQKLV